MTKQHKPEEPIEQFKLKRKGITLPARRTMLIAAGSVLALVAIITLGLVYKHQPGQTPPKSKTADSPTVLTKEQQAYKDVTTQTQTYDNNGQYTEEAKTLKTYIESNPTTDYKLQSIVMLGAAYLNAKDYPNALIYYQQALDLSTTPSQKMAAIHGLALTYKWSGDAQSAIAQYNAAIAIAKTLPNDDQAQRIIKVDSAAIVQLGGGQ